MITAQVTEEQRTTRAVPWSVRGAQGVLLLPLGLLQLVATIVFSVAEGLHDAQDWIVGAWAPPMAMACAFVGLRLARREAGVVRAAALLLFAQAVFSAVKLVSYHESASFVFLGLVAATVTLLALPASRRYYR
jgi:hypothetical protein